MSAMARGHTAAARLKDDTAAVRGLVVLAVLTAVMLGATWPSPPSDEYAADGHGSAVLAGIVLLGGGLAVGFAAWQVWRQFRPGGPHWHDRWQVKQGELVDQVLSGVTFQAPPVPGGRAGEGLAQGGVKAAMGIIGVAGVPVVGQAAIPVLAPLAAGALAVAAVGAVMAINGPQSRADQEATRLIRGTARAHLADQLPGLQARRASARGRRRARLDRQILWTRDGIARIEMLGYAPVP